MSEAGESETADRHAWSALALVNPVAVRCRRPTHPISTHVAKVGWVGRRRLPGDGWVGGSGSWLGRVADCVGALLQSSGRYAGAGAGWRWDFFHRVLWPS